MKSINRREFIKKSAMTGIALSSIPLPNIAFADPSTDTVLVTIMLSGGPDFRYCLVPPYDSTPGSYGYEFWAARARTYELSPLDLDGLEALWTGYLHPSNPSFGIHPNCSWLWEQYQSGNVAIVSNVYASTNRDHAHSTLMLERGDLTAGPNDKGLSGWGGRLATACNTNVCSVSGSVRQFCFGPHPTNPLDHDNSIVIDGKDTREMGLYEYLTEPENDNSWRWNTRGIMSRALTSYYAAKAQEISDASPYHQIIQHEQSVRRFGRLVNTRLESVPIPPAISDLYTSSTENELANHSFGRQIRNIYDVMACDDLLQTNIIGADYGGWDHHRYMKDDIEPKLSDLFGTGKGLQTLYSEIANNQSGKEKRLVFLIYGEFGRQLAANGDYGTDHGEGNYALLIGDRVIGGVYGDMFPSAEIPLFSERGSDIKGLTSYEQVIARLCENIKVGSANSVIPGWESSELESGVDLSNLLSST